MAVFKIGEFINMAIKDEETGIAFYRALGEVADNLLVKKTCERLAAQEEIHANRFRRMFEEVGLETPKKEEYDGQYEQYLNYLLSSRAFPNPSDAAKKASQSMNAKDSIEIAMDMEKDALLFYGEIVKLIPDTHAKYVEDIIAEERGHLQDLYAIWEQL